ncbi:MAG: S8 family peptidase [Actinobacteria bacterium]|nr:S8 family peptidase [Actinomycetota bacterium]MDQ3164267.1 S8 family peptidase [Actinomycetota bacterium]
MKKINVVVAFVVLAVAAVLVPTAGSAEPSSRYIVVFKDFAAPESAPLAGAFARRFGGRAEQVYEHALKGFTISLPPQLAEALAADPRIAYVEKDQELTTQTTQSGATWGLDRIDERGLPVDGSFTYTAAGAGVKAYVIDTGIRFDHSEFGDRAVSGFDSIDGGTADDCNGHGTHVAGTIGGSTYGVAKSVGLVGVRVLNCSGSGTTAGVIAGIDWVTGDHAEGESAVANMSLGGGVSTALDNAVKASIADGVSYAVAAGNSNTNACNASPARVADAMTIGATNADDTRASFSNRGNCVDWFAPGVSITSAWYTSPTATGTISGTSMATPHTSGVAALYLQENPGASPLTVRTALFDATTKDIVASARSANNHLLFTDL